MKTKTFKLLVFVNGKWLDVFSGSHAEVLEETINFTRFKIEEIIA